MSTPTPDVSLREKDAFDDLRSAATTLIAMYAEMQTLIDAGKVNHADAPDEWVGYWQALERFKKAVADPDYVLLALSRVERAEADSLKLLDALADVVVKATEYGTQDGGFVANYILPTGPLHRAIPLLQDRGIVVRPGMDGRRPLFDATCVCGHGQHSGQCPHCGCMESRPDHAKAIDSIVAHFTAATPQPEESTRE